MSDVPSRCPVCSTDIPPGRNRCLGCGKVFGEDNRCPHCYAIAPVLRSQGGVICAACSKPREIKPGTVTVGDAPGLAIGISAPSAAVAARAGGGGLRILGALLIGAGVMAAAVATLLVPGAIGIALAVLAGGAGVGLGALALRGGSKVSAHATRTEQTALELRILDLAEKSDGDLTATEVARALNLSLEHADAALTRMADGSRVAVEVDENGVVHYVFRELKAGPSPSAKVRVAAEELEAQEEAAAGTESNPLKRRQTD